MPGTHIGSRSYALKTMITYLVISPDPIRRVDGGRLHRSIGKNG